MWLFLLAARHRMQAFSALACCVGCGFSGFASLELYLLIHILHKEAAKNSSLFVLYQLCYYILIFTRYWYGVAVRLVQLGNYYPGIVPVYNLYIIGVYEI